MVLVVEGSLGPVRGSGYDSLLPPLRGSAPGMMGAEQRARRRRRVVSLPDRNHGTFQSTLLVTGLTTLLTTGVTYARRLWGP